MLLTPAFNPKYEKTVGLYTDVLRVKADSHATCPRSCAAARRIWGKEQTFQVQPLGIETEGARNAIDVLTLTLWIFAGVAALAGAVAIGIVLSRELARSAVNPSTLRALGITRRQAVAADRPAPAIVAVGGAVLAGIAAFLLSPRSRWASPAAPTPTSACTPTGACSCSGCSRSAPSCSRSRSSPRGAPSTRPRPIAPTAAWTHVVDRRARHTRRAASRRDERAAHGAEAGRGSSSVPVRTAFAGTIFGIAGITAVLVFGASLAHLVDTPRLAGWTWNLRAEVPTDASNPKAICVDRNDHGLNRISGVVAVTAVCTQGIEVDGRSGCSVGRGEPSG